MHNAFIHSPYLNIYLISIFCIKPKKHETDLITILPGLAWPGLFGLCDIYVPLACLPGKTK